MVARKGPSPCPFYTRDWTIKVIVLCPFITRKPPELKNQRACIQRLAAASMRTTVPTLFGVYRKYNLEGSKPTKSRQSRMSSGAVTAERLFTFL